MSFTFVIRRISIMLLLPLWNVIFQTPSYGNSRAANAVVSTQNLGWGIDGHPSTRTAKYSFRVQNISSHPVSIRELGVNVQNLHLIKPSTWSTSVSIAPGKSVPVTVVYKATSCRAMPNISAPMRLQIKIGASSWRSIGIRLTAVNGPGHWARSVLEAACDVRTVVHG